MIHTVHGFSVVNEADVFLEFSFFFYDPADVGNLTFGSSAFSKTSLNIWKFSVHVLSQPSLENFEHYFASMWDECNWEVVEHSWASLVTQVVKNMPAIWETWVPSLGWEDHLEKGKATHSSILAWSIPWTIAQQAPLPWGFSRQEYWCGLPPPLSRGFSQAKDRTQVTCIAGGFFTSFLSHQGIYSLLYGTVYRVDHLTW